MFFLPTFLKSLYCLPFTVLILVLHKWMMMIMIERDLSSVLMRTLLLSINQSISFITCRAAQSKYSKHRTKVKGRQYKILKQNF